jgi:uncharacterized flavoprotein (TIGR03862 family)
VVSDSLLNPAVAIVGGGPAGLMAAEILMESGLPVTIFDHMPSLGRKFLMAGRGGLNLTHSEPLDRFLDRYGAARGHLEPAIRAFPPEALIGWCEGLGQETFIGTSGRVFPRSMKASPLLRAWLRRLADQGVRVATRHRWTGWDAAGALTFQTADGLAVVRPAATILALGGASWPRLGSDGRWANLLAEDVDAFQPSNCGVLVGWPDAVRTRFAGHPLKRIAVRFGDVAVKGEAVISETGLEGGAIYALSARLRDAIRSNGQATPQIDLRPDLDLATLGRRLSLPRRGQSLSTVLRKQAGLAPAAVALVLAAMHRGEGQADLAGMIKALPVTVHGLRGIERAISSAGGLRWSAVTDDFMLVRRPGTFAAGEMLDWEAPTGGYLLQACFSTGVRAARGVLSWLDASRQTGT